MDRISSYMISQRALYAILGQQSSLTETQLQLATGKRAINPSDDPASAARVLDLNRAIATIRQYQSNANTAKGRLELEIMRFRSWELPLYLTLHRTQQSKHRLRLQMYRGLRYSSVFPMPTLKLHLPLA